MTRPRWPIWPSGGCAPRSPPSPRRQLPEIAAGGAFAALAQQLGAATLRRNRRQVQRWEREALSALREGNPKLAVDRYAGAGRVQVGADARSVLAQMVADWWTGRNRGEDVAMLAGRRALVAALNCLARQRLVDAGELGEEQVVAGPIVRTGRRRDRRSQ